MFGAITWLWNALASLAGQVEALAGTVGLINGQLRQRLALDAPADTPAINHATPTERGQTPAIGQAAAGTSANGRGGRGRRADV